MPLDEMAACSVATFILSIISAVIHVHMNHLLSHDGQVILVTRVSSYPDISLINVKDVIFAAILTAFLRHTIHGTDYPGAITSTSELRR